MEASTPPAAVAGWAAADPPIEVADNASAVERADLTILAVPFSTVDELLREQHAAGLSDGDR